MMLLEDMVIIRKNPTTIAIIIAAFVLVVFNNAVLVNKKSEAKTKKSCLNINMNKFITLFHQ